MAQDIITSCLIYFLLFIYQTPNPTTASFREGLKKDKIYLNQCQNCDPSKKVDAVFNGESKYVKSFYKTMQKYPNHPYNLLLRGWGARGMPFNVLYTPNAHQQKIMKSVPPKETFAKESPALPEIYDLVLEDEKSSSKTPDGSLKKHLVPRKYYSLIPQLFVSYGW